MEEEKLREKKRQEEERRKEMVICLGLFNCSYFVDVKLMILVICHDDIIAVIYFLRFYAKKIQGFPNIDGDDFHSLSIFSSCEIRDYFHCITCGASVLELGILLI